RAAARLLDALRRRPQHRHLFEILRGSEVELRRHASITRIAPVRVPARLEPDLETGAQNTVRRRLRSRHQPRGATRITVPARHIVRGKYRTACPWQQRATKERQSKQRQSK